MSVIIAIQEQLHLLSFDAVKADKEQLEREIRGLKKEVDDWKVNCTIFNVGKQIIQS